ncbi:MAG: hypothetical protein LBT21_01525 [Oscillospiraceae bacterium]|jgi:hypothetical protein|nr:hypothetical protein [Oscillospiraceae bacterium]
MDFLRSWMLSVTAAALAGMLVYILAPKGGTKKAVRMVAAVFFLTAFFLPFGQITADNFTLPEIAKEDVSHAIPPALEETLQAQVLQAQQAVVARAVNAELARQNAPPPERIEFGMDILPDGSIGIIQARIQCAGGAITADALRIALESKIREDAGLDIQVVLS